MTFHFLRPRSPSFGHVGFISSIYAQFQTVTLIFRVNFYQKITMIDVVLREISITPNATL